MEELKKDIAELKQLANAATRPKVKDIVQIQVRKLETDLILLEEKEMAEKSPSSEFTEESTKRDLSSGIAPTFHSYKYQINTYAWDQSEKFVKIYLSDNMNGVQDIAKEKITCTFTPNSVRCTVRGFNNKTQELFINNLFDDIVPPQSSYKIKKDMILLMLYKKTQSKQWGYVTKQEAKIKDAEEKKKKKSKKDVVDPDGDPSASLMGLLKQMYDDGDDEMKRTLAKAWSESQEKRTRGEED